MSTKLKILVVDDDADLAGTVVTGLRMRGHDARRAHGALAAVELAEVFNPDAVLMDLDMRPNTGLEAGVMIRLHARHAGPVVIVAFTAWKLADVTEVVLKAGFDGILPKPSSLEAIEAELSRLVASRTATARL